MRARLRVDTYGTPPAEAVELHRTGRRLASAGRYAEALAKFAAAARLAPSWPYPRYDAAFTHLLSGDAVAALAAYREVDRLAPGGFFTTKTAVHTLEAERTGALPPGAYLDYLKLEWIEDEGEQKRYVRYLLQRYPRLAPVWKEHAFLTESDPQKLAALETGLSLGPDAETAGVLSINKALALSRLGRRREGIRDPPRAPVRPRHHPGREEAGRAVPRAAGPEARMTLSPCGPCLHNEAPRRLCSQRCSSSPRAAVPPT